MYLRHLHARSIRIRMSSFATRKPRLTHISINEMRPSVARFLTMTLLVWAAALATAADPKTSSSAGSEAESRPPVAWDYSPYRILIWLSSDDPSITVAGIEDPLRDYLDRDFSSVWRLDLATTPTAIGTLAARNMSALNYDLITASDPVIAVKRDHPDAVRIRTVNNVAEFCKSVLVTKNGRDSVIARGTVNGDATIHGVADRLSVVDGDELTVCKRWADPETEALIVSRGMAETLVDPEAKLITPSISDLVVDVVDQYDKIFIVHVQRHSIPNAIRTVEIDTLMRHFGPVVTEQFPTVGSITSAIGRGVTRAFAPVVRIENAGRLSATGLLRARGLINDDSSPAWIAVNDPLEPMVRKNDRNGTPTAIGRMDWAYLLATEIEERYLKMDFYAGRAGTLQGRKNKRTFRMALKARPQGDSTTLRLHLQRDPNFPLIGYELYEKELKSRKMTFVGRTDWNGRLTIEQSDFPLRLLYVKNGGAVLARLPMVPGLYPTAVADLSGDDMRLQAEAYVRGVQNNITDLIAMRMLYSTRIRKYLEAGEMETAERMMNSLRKQPNHEELSAAIGRKQVEFLEEIGNRNIGQRKKVDEMFTTTRELLSKHITPKIIRDLESDIRRAKENGGRLPKAEGEAEAEGEADTEVEAEAVSTDESPTEPASESDTDSPDTPQDGPEASSSPPA